MKTYFATLSAARQKTAGFLFFYLALSVIVSVCGVATNHFLGELSQAAVEFDVTVLVHFLGIMAVLAAIEAVSAAFKMFVQGRFSGGTAFKARQYFARHFTRVKFSELAGQDSGGLLSVYTNDLPRAALFAAESVPGLISESLYVVIVFIYMAAIQPVFTLIYFLMFPLLIFMQAKISAPIQEKAIAMSAGRQQFNAVVNDSLRNIPTVVAYSLEQTMEDRYLSAYDSFFEASKSYLRLLMLLVMSGVMATMLPLLFIFGASGFAVVNGGMDISAFIAFTGVSSLAANWISMLSQQLLSFSVNAASAEKMNTAMAGEEENYGADAAAHTADEKNDGTGFGARAADKEHNGLAPIQHITQALDTTAPTMVEFSNVSFSYGEGKDKVLRNVSFAVKKGARVAIVGESGSGKSTLLKLLLGLYEPSAGTVLLSGTDIHNLPIGGVRAQLAYVPQDSFMFPETIRENLNNAPGRVGEPYPNPRGSEEALREACASAGILDFINGLPGGFDTVLAESAENISGGQRQRLAIARAYLQNAPVVLFDEATAALDPATEADVLQAFLKTTEGKTVLMVAHRQAAIEACDVVVTMDKGAVKSIAQAPAITEDRSIGGSHV